MSGVYDRVSSRVFAAKRDVERRLITHSRKCQVAIIKVQLEVASEFLNLALDRISKKTRSE